MIWRPRKMWQTQQLPVLQHIVSQDDPTSMICGHPRPKAQGHPQFRSNIQLLAQVHSSHSWTCTHWSPWICEFPSQNAGVLHSKIMDLPSFFLGLFPPKMLGLSTEKSPLPGLRPRLDEFTGLRRQLAEDLVPVVISHDPPGEMPWCCRSTSWCCETRSCHGQKLTGAQ